jgi:D-serine deaminase-like pyridoxal phosphate-dependent protein
MWYQIDHTDNILSPSLLFYKARIESNIDKMISIAGGPDRLIPHVKTHKCGEVVKLQLAKGITKFKCATIAEAEMLAQADAKWILLAYQLVGPNQKRLVALTKAYNDVQFFCLVDNENTAHSFNALAEENDIRLSVFIDVNNGMNRTGHITDDALPELLSNLQQFKNLIVAGVHVYDGHIGDSDFAERKSHVDQAFDTVRELLNTFVSQEGEQPMVIAGGSPSFTVHVQRPDVYLSPGTNVLWDWGYQLKLPEQSFDHAALLLTRVISKPKPGIITIDLGHKAVAAENPIEKRFKILNLDGYKVLSQSEEHGVLEVGLDQWEDMEVGKVCYALPYHICPTVALHNYATVIENHNSVAEWEIAARSRRILV